MEKYGIQALKKATLEVIDLSLEVRKGLNDGKFNWIELIGLSDNASGLAGVAMTWKTIVEEIRDLSILERAELNQYVMESLPRQKIKGVDLSAYSMGLFIAETIDLILAVTNYTLRTKDLFKK